MATYYVDDGGDGTTGASWATAYTSINALDTAVALASGDIVYFGHDSQCQATNSANLTITGPTSGAPVVFISATQGSNPPTYAQATGNQIDTTEGAYYVAFDGSFALYGIKVNSGSHFFATADQNESFFADGCILAPGANSFVDITSSIGFYEIKNLTVDLTSDGTTTRTVAPIRNYIGAAIVNGLSFVNAGYRTGSVFGSASATTGPINLRISGADFSGFTNATLCELFAGSTGNDAILVGCKTAATWGVYAGTKQQNDCFKMVNCGTADQPVALNLVKYTGDLVSSSSIYRTSGASFESTANAWLITTAATCTLDSPFYSEYIYGTISSTGSKTFDLYITNDTADFDDDEVWLEVEYKADASSGKWTLITDKIATRTTTPAAQTDDTGSTWNGTGPSFTYKQKLSVTATVNTIGQYRARVAVGVASIASSRYFYCDPLIGVS